jgi:hypothetical protein
MPGWESLGGSILELDPHEHIRLRRLGPMRSRSGGEVPGECLSRTSGLQGILARNEGYRTPESRYR